MSASKNIARKSMALGPSVKLLLSRYAIDPNKITSTGPHKVLLKSDVLTYISSGANSTQANSSSSSSNFDQKPQRTLTDGQSVGKRNEVTFFMDEVTARSIYNFKLVSEEEIDTINVSTLYNHLLVCCI